MGLTLGGIPLAKARLKRRCASLAGRVCARLDAGKRMALNETRMGTENKAPGRPQSQVQRSAKTKVDQRNREEMMAGGLDMHSQEFDTLARSRESDARMLRHPRPQVVRE